MPLTTAELESKLWGAADITESQVTDTIRAQIPTCSDEVLLRHSGRAANHLVEGLEHGARHG